MTTAVIFNIQRFSVHDGPGIRTTVFLKGCPLRCAWCHNPESMDPRPEVMINADRCIACDACLPVCAPGLTGPLAVGDSAHRPGPACERCGACADVCPTGARERVGRTMSPAETAAEAARDRTYYQASGGGVTFSGGEPLTAVNAGFTLEALDECRRVGLHTAVDTCGHVDRGALLEAGRRADVVLYDLKLMDPVRHRAAVGVDNERVLDNLRALSASRADVRIRVPLVPGVTDGESDLDALGRFVADLPARHPVHLLPYHGTARDKYGRMGLEYDLGELPAPTEQTVAAAAERLSAFGLDVQIGG